MIRPAFLVFCISLSLITLGLPAAARSANYTLAPSPQSSDEVALRAAIEQYLAALPMEDLDAITRMWSEKLSDAEQRKKALEGFFSTIREIEVKNIRIRRLSIEGDRADVLATFELNGIDIRSGKPALGLGKVNRKLEFTKEAEGWKVSNEAWAEFELAARLVEAKGELEYAALIAEDRELLTPWLARRLQLFASPHGAIVESDRSMNAYLAIRYVAEQMGDKAWLAEAFNGIAVHLESRGNLDAAFELYEKSLKLREEPSNRHTLTVPLSNIGYAYQKQGDYGAAMEKLQQALVLAEEAGEKNYIANCLLKIGIIHRLQYNFDLALDYLKRGLDLSEEMNNRAFISDSLQELSTTYAQTGDYNSALEFGQRNLKVADEMQDVSAIALALNNIGTIHSLRGNYSLALDYHQKALSRIERGDAKRTQIASLKGVGTDYLHLGDYEKAIEYNEQAASLARQAGYLTDLSDALARAGEAYRALGRDSDARQAFDEAIETIETLRKQLAGGEEDRQRFFEEQTLPYYGMVQMLVSQNRPDEALLYAERAKGRVLLEVLYNGRRRVTKTLSADEQEQERRVVEAVYSLNKQIRDESASKQPDQTRLSDLKAQLKRAHLNHRDHQTRLYAVHPEVRVQRGEAQSLKAEEAIALLPDSNTALLEYAVTDDTTYLFVLTRAANKTVADLKLYSISVKRKELASLVESFRQKLASHNLLIREPATRVYDLLLKPAQAQLKGKTHVVIVPDDVLWELPFQASVTGAGRYFIEESAISYAPSLTVLREMVAGRNKRARPADKTASLLALGNPTPSKETIARVKLVRRDEELQPLPEAEREVKTLGQLYGTTQSKVFIGAEAREDRAKAEAGRFNVLHFATHGVLNNASPMYSHLVLSQGEGTEDGLLEAWELMGMDLRAGLVVLSACETARGRVGAGEGMIGLSWALFVAGSPTTVVSQWKVDSASTSQMMLEFHRSYRASGSKAEGLRKAMLKLLRSNQYKHPFYWAPFVVIGDGY